MAIKQLDPEITLRLLEGHQNAVSPLARERDDFYKKQKCNECGSTALQKTQDPKRIFQENDPIARWLLNCKDCGAVFDPHTGLLINMGNPARAMVPTVPIFKGPHD